MSRDAYRREEAVLVWRIMLRGANRALIVERWAERGV